MNEENNLNFLFNNKNDFNNTNIDKNQQKAMEPQFEFVKGSDFRKEYYNQNIIETIYVRYYQIALFNDVENQLNNKRCVRSLLLKGETSKGGHCFFNYQIVSVKDYKLSENKINTFIDYLNGLQQNNNLKIKHKFYPVYNFNNVDPPSGNEINECVSDLLT